MAIAGLVLFFSAFSVLASSSPVGHKNKMAVLQEPAPQEEFDSLLKIRGIPLVSQTPPFIMDIYRKLENEEKLQSEASQEVRKTAKSLKFFHTQRFENQEYHFNISSVSRNEIVRAAELYLFTMKPGTLLAYDVTSGHNLSPQSPGSSGWISMNITSVFQDWLENPQSNRGIRLIGEENLNYEQYPWLVVYTDYEEKAPRPTSLRGIGQRRSLKKRNRRHTDNDVIDGPEVRGSCRRSRMFVNFTDIGMNTVIIAPEGYNAYRCRGTCAYPIPRARFPTNHAIVQSLVHLNQKKARGPCCVPVTLTPISVLYLDEQMNVVYKKFDNMVVKKCGCR